MTGYFDDYDYEESYQKQIATLEQWEIEHLIREKKLGRVYMTQTTKAGNQMEVDIYPAMGARHDLPRGKREKKSREKQKRLNDKRAQRRFINLVNANFGAGDLYCTWTYDEGHLPGSIEEAQQIFRNFIKRINRLRTKRGQDNIKYIVVTEWSEGEKGIRVHHHAVMERMDRDELEKLWKHGTRNQTRIISPDKDTHLTGMASYISKDPRGKKRWSSSRGLKQPEVKRVYGKFAKKRVEQMALDASYLKQQLEQRYQGYRLIDSDQRTNDLYGGCYIYARMVRT